MEVTHRSPGNIHTAGIPHSTRGDHGRMTPLRASGDCVGSGSAVHALARGQSLEAHQTQLTKEATVHT